MREVVGIDYEECVGRGHGRHEPVKVTDYLGGDTTHLVAFRAKGLNLRQSFRSRFRPDTDANKGADGSSVGEIDLSGGRARIQHYEKFFVVEDFDIVGGADFNRSRQKMPGRLMRRRFYPSLSL